MRTLHQQIKADAAAWAKQPMRVRAAVEWELDRLRNAPREEREPEAPLFYLP